MAVIRMRGWRRWIAPAGAAVSLVAAAATAYAEPIVPAAPAAGCGETLTATTDPACDGAAARPGRGPAVAPPPLPMSILAPPPARPAPTSNTPAGALVPPAPGPGGNTPIVPAR
ncbi:hypothetical protein ACLMAJ_29885 [Nocardia sp. KC 131]|uniref:hypothetical protein n=1 Tax=Nocardia arseniciresistens TaxID=3392119 RepID=UPI00398F30F1